VRKENETVFAASIELFVAAPSEIADFVNFSTVTSLQVLMDFRGDTYAGHPG
jgi:hypothetical protein